MADLDTSRTQKLPRFVRLAGREEHTVPRLGANSGNKVFPLMVREILRHRTTQCAVFGDQDVGQTLSATLFRPVLPSVKLTTGLIAATWHHDRTDIRCLENPERG